MAALSPPLKIPNASWKLIPLIALIKIGEALLAASSAARFMERMALSTCLPNPILRKVFSAFCASAGINILMAASLKKPSIAEILLVPFSVPTFKASFNPLIISSLLNADFPPDIPSILSTEVLPEESFFVAFFIKPFKPCACKEKERRYRMDERRRKRFIE